MAHEGGCFCGALRYRADAEPLRIFHCHCTICRRVQAAPVVTWITFPTPAWSWTKGPPAELKSTPEATRYFCRDCGTHLAFILDGAAELDVTAGSLRDPATAKPGYHIFADTRLPWLQLADDLPEYDDWGPRRLSRVLARKMAPSDIDLSCRRSFAKSVRAWLTCFHHCIGAEH